MGRFHPRLRRVLLAALLLFLIALPVGYGFLEYTARPQFCASCHIMEPYVASWEASSHKKVKCIDCHFEPGVLEMFEGKFKALSQLAKYVTRTQGTKPWAEVSDASCMRSGCHTTRLLEGQVPLKVASTSIAFDHRPHLLEMRRSKKLRCTSCHSQIVQGQHMTVTSSTCFLCHFKGAQEDPKLSNCNTCHGAPKKEIDLGGFVFKHDDYLARGVECVSCHADVTRGSGEVPRQRCNQCHAAVQHIERYGETEFLHRQHVTEKKVDCLNCHTEIVHKLPERKAPPAPEGSCAQCHNSAHGISEQFYRGEGGRGVPPTPSAMHFARVACTSCHKNPPGMVPKNGAAPPAQEIACLSCHGVGYEGMLARWQGQFGRSLDAVEKELAGASEAASAAPAAVRQSLEDARHDAALVRADGSKGVHNPWFARKLLESAMARANEAWASADPNHAAAKLPLGPTFPTKLGCALVCHLGIEEKTIGVAGTRFDHARHLLRDGHDCDACHSTSEHGKTLVSKENCASCHHPARTDDAALLAAGKGCVTCHAEIDAFLRGVKPGGGEPVSVKGKVACIECHGDGSKGPALRVAKENCERCHDEKMPETADSWVALGEEWFAEAEPKLASLRDRAKAAGGVAADRYAAAESTLVRLRRVRPAHNVLLFDEEKESFEEALAACEKALQKP